MNSAHGKPRIVVGVDESPASLAALRWAAREAGLRATRLQVVRAWERARWRLAPYASRVRPGGRDEDRAAAGARLEGAVRLGYRKELEAIEDPVARRARYEELVAEQYTRGQALSTAMAFEIDDVIDPAVTRDVITGVLARFSGG